MMFWRGVVAGSGHAFRALCARARSHRRVGYARGGERITGIPTSGEAASDGPGVPIRPKPYFSPVPRNGAPFLLLHSHLWVVHSRQAPAPMDPAYPGPHASFRQFSFHERSGTQSSTVECLL